MDRTADFADRLLDDADISSMPSERALEDLFSMLQYVNNQLTIFGLPAIQLDIIDGADIVDQTQNRQILRCFIALLDQRQKDFDFREDMDDQYRRLENEQDTLMASMNKLRAKLDASERESDTVKSKLIQTEAAVREHADKHRLTKEELKTFKSSIQYSKSQYTHELRKRELDLTKYKEKLQKAVSDKYRASKVGIHVLNPMDRAHREDDEKTRELMDMVAAQYDDRERQLLQENGQLRLSLYTLQKEMNAAIAEMRLSDDLQVPEMFAMMDAKSELGEDVSMMDVPAGYQLPFESFRTMYESYIKTILARLRVAMGHMNEGKADARLAQRELDQRMQEVQELNEQIISLRQEAGEMRETIRLQEQRIQEVLQEQRNAAANPDTSMDAGELAKERANVDKERRRLEEERKRFTAAAIELGKERAALQAEKLRLQEEKLKSDTKSFLSGMPATPQWLKGVDPSLDTPYLMNQAVTGKQHPATTGGADPSPLARNAGEELDLVAQTSTLEISPTTSRVPKQ